MSLRLKTDFSLRRALWPTDSEALRSVRHTVFVVEQGVPAELEWDNADADAWHMLALDAQGKAIGTARLRREGHIGRMAVIPAWRGCGVGTAMLHALLELARAEGLSAIDLNAQTQACGFYARHGFTAQGDTFMEAGIPHRHMALTL